MSAGYRPENAATDGMLSRSTLCYATDGFLCLRERPRGGGKRKYWADDIDWEKLKERTRKLRDRKDLEDLSDIVRILFSKGIM